MPVATTTQAGRTVLTPAAERIIENATARRARIAAEARAKRADVTTPIPAPFAVEQLPEPPPLFDDAPAPAAEAAPPPARTITLATTVGYRDYQIVVTATGMTLDQFCDMLDKRLGVVS